MIHKRGIDEVLLFQVFPTDCHWRLGWGVGGWISFTYKPSKGVLKLRYSLPLTAMHLASKPFEGDGINMIILVVMGIATLKGFGVGGLLRRRWQNASILPLEGLLGNARLRL